MDVAGLGTAGGGTRLAATRFAQVLGAAGFGGAAGVGAWAGTAVAGFGGEATGVGSASFCFSCCNSSFAASPLSASTEGGSGSEKPSDDCSAATGAWSEVSSPADP